MQRKLYEGPVEVYHYDENFQRIGPVPSYRGTVINRYNDVHTYQVSVAVTHPTWALTMKDHDVTGHHLTISRGPDSPLIAGPITSSRLAFRSGQWSLEVQGENYLAYLHRSLTVPSPTRKIDQQDVEGYYKLPKRPAEQNIKQLVRELCSDSAGRPEYSRPLRVEANQGRGKDTKLNSRFKNLLEEVQELAEVGELIMFTDLEQVDLHTFHPVFDVRQSRDLSKQVIITTGNGGVIEADLNNSAPKITQVLVAGQGQSEERTLVNVEGVVGDWNLRSTAFQDRRDTDEHSELIQAGEKTLADNVESVSISAVIVELEFAKYARDFLVGDFIGLGIGGGPQKERVVEATTEWSSTGTRTSIATGTTQQDGTATISQLRNIVRAIQPGRTI